MSLRHMCDTPLSQRIYERMTERKKWRKNTAIVCTPASKTIEIREKKRQGLVGGLVNTKKQKDVISPNDEILESFPLYCWRSLFWRRIITT
eukprot:scaffold6528_cov114-Cylindrotheca_fusiformis.AAC.17